MMLASSASVGVAMSSGNRPQRFKLSLPFLHKKKKRQNLLQNNPVADLVDLQETGLGDIHEEDDEEEQHYDGQGSRLHDNGDQDGTENDVEGQPEDNDDENLTIALVPKYFSHTIQLQNIKSPVTYRTYDIQFPPSTTSHQSSRRKSKTSPPRGLDNPTATSGPLAAPNMTTTGVGCQSWVKARCGYGSCSKQIDLEKGSQRQIHGHRDRAGQSRRRSSRAAKSTDPDAWDRESEWSVLAEVENEVVNKKANSRKKRGHKKSSKLAPTPSATECVRVTTTPEGKCSLRDPYEEVREAAKYGSPALDQLRALEVDCSAGSHLLTTSTDVEVNSAEELRIHPWERSFSSPSSDDELFTTSIEVEGQGKHRKKKWTSNSSDDTECRQRRTSFHSRSKSTWSRDSTMTVAEEDEANAVEIQKSRGKKGSRIIFLSTPPRPKEPGVDDEDEQPAPGSIVKCSSDRHGDYSKLEPILKDPGTRFDKTFTTNTAYKANLPPTVFESDLEANAKAWSKLDLRTIKEGDANETSIRELAMISRTKEPRRIDVHIEDQICNLRLESEASDSSQGKSYSSRGSRRHVKVLPKSKSLDQEKPSKKKRSSASSRRRKGRSRSKVPPLLPNDLHGKVKESVAVVKSSYDPYTDFRDSMVEMIVEKEIQGAGDLEELLRCYLSLNSAEYHSVIVKVFADVWRELFSDNI